jgi:hypothetical protein
MNGSSQEQDAGFQFNQQIRYWERRKFGVYLLPGHRSLLRRQTQATEPHFYPEMKTPK